MEFEVKARDGLARIGELKTAHGVLSTPALLPVVNPNLREVPPSELRDTFGFKALITNAYIIRRSPELRQRALKEGLHALLGFDGPIMTDSGTFQQHIYGEVSATNEEILRFQFDIGTDIATPLDLFTEPDESEAKARADWAETFKRYGEAFKLEAARRPTLACAVQGGSHIKVRAEAAQALGSLPPCVHPIGGIVPIMEGERYPLLADVIATSKAGLPPSRPVHLFGAGHPLVIPMAVMLGCDLFDSSSYAKYAKDGRMLYPDGTRSLADLVEHPCSCPVCSRHSPNELRAMEEKERTGQLARHNLYVLSGEIRGARQAVREESIAELAESRARANPRLFEALRRLAQYGDLLEGAEPVSRARAVRYFDSTSAVRPIVERTRQRVLDRLPAAQGAFAVLLRPKGTPYARRLPHGLAKARLKAHIPLVFETIWGPVPEELDEAWPFSQTVAPEVWDGESASRVACAVESYARTHEGLQLIRYADAALPLIAERFTGAPRSEAQEGAARVEATLRYEFGEAAAKMLEGRAVEVTRSRRTRKIRTVMVEGEHALSMRAYDGLLTLTFVGGARLKATLPAPARRVQVEDDTAPFNAQGRSVFSKFVAAADPSLRPGDEVLVVDSRDHLAAVGRLLLSPPEIKSFKFGVAVQVREGAKSPAPA